MKKLLLLLLFAALLPLPAATAPGNIFIEGETVTLTLPEDVSGLTILDIDGNPCFAGRKPAAGRLELGVVPIGFYRVEYLTGGKKQIDSLTVLLKPVIELDDSNPVAADAALFYPFFLRQQGSMHFSYSADDVTALLRRINIGLVRERLMWESFDYLADAKNLLVDELMTSYRKQGIKVVQSLYGTPAAYRYPAEMTSQGKRKPPLDLRKLHDYVLTVAKRSGDTIAAIETWNEPEGIGGGLLSFEIAATQKTAFLAARKVHPSPVSFMGFGTPENPAGLLRNDINRYQDVFCYHHHSPWQEAAPRAARYRKPSSGLPLWLTEVSTGSFDIDPAIGELSLENARKQALEIPKLFAEYLAEGAEKLFFFFLFQHTEVNGKSYGLLRHRDLSPRPGLATLATLAGHLQEYRGAVRLETLPDHANGYEFSGGPYRTQLLWSNAGAVPFSAAGALFAKDAFGRPIDISGDRVELNDMPLYLFFPGSGTPAPVKKTAATAVSEIVLQLELPDNARNGAADAILLPVGEKRAYPLAVYNFSSREHFGEITAAFSGGEAAPVVFSGIRLPANSRTLLALEFHLLRGSSSPVHLRIEGCFGAQEPVSILETAVIPVRNRVMPDDLATPIPGWNDATKWRKSIIKDSEMSVIADREWTIFDYRFGNAENQVVGHVWASPVLPLNVRDFPEFVPGAVAFELRIVEGTGVENIGLNLVENDGATYFATLPFDQEKLKTGQEFIVSLPSMVNPRFRKQDSNGSLDVELLTSLEIPVWAKPGNRIRLAVKNLRWINHPDGHKTKIGEL